MPSLAGLIARADLAIGAAGSTTWERICLGLPTIAFSIAMNQEHTIHNLENHGYLWSGTSFSLSSLLDDKLNLSDMSRRCFDLVDGNGIARISKVMSIY